MSVLSLTVSVFPVLSLTVPVLPVPAAGTVSVDGRDFDSRGSHRDHDNPGQQLSSSHHSVPSPYLSK